jgi:hypothetical protein
MSEERSHPRSSMDGRTWIIAFMIIEFLGFIPVLGIFGFLSNKRFGKNIWPRAAIIWLALYCLTALRLRFLRCPRCKKRYFGNFLALFGDFVSLGQRNSLISEECANCGFRNDSN